MIFILRVLAVVVICLLSACSTTTEHNPSASTANATASPADSISQRNNEPPRSGPSSGVDAGISRAKRQLNEHPFLSPISFRHATVYTAVSVATPLHQRTLPALGLDGKSIVESGVQQPATKSKLRSGSGKQTKKKAIQYKDIWARIVSGFQFSQTQPNKRTRREVTLYSRHPADLARTFKRSEPFLHYIVEEAEKRGLPMELALLPVVESAFNPFAYSPVRAAGIWQFIPGTGKYYGLKQSQWYDGRRDVTASTHAAFNYLQALSKRFDGDWLLALAAYNSGAGRVIRAINHNKRNDKPTDFWHLKLPRETRKYVPRLLAIAQIVAEPQRYGVALHPIANKPVFKVAEIDSQIDLTKAATLAGMTIDDLYAYNPGFKKWATDPHGPHRLAIPTGRINQFNVNLAKLPKAERVSWKKYQVKKGDNLTVIAKKFNTSVKSLKDANRIKGSLIRVGKLMIIPNVPGYQLAEVKRVTNSGSRKTGSRKVFYKIKKGDTLWDISNEHHVSIRKLARWNKMSPSDILHPGRTLVLWTKPDQARYLASATQYKNNKDLRKIGYQVKSGDSLYRIANKFRVSVIDLLQWNGINANAFLQPGQLLNIFVSD